MPRLFLALIVGAVVVALAWLLAGIPGHVSASIGSMTIETSVPMAILALITLFGVVVLLLRILSIILGLPRTTAGWRSRSRRRGGETAVTRVLVALAAGEQGAARKEARKARALLGDTPQTLLLAAEAGRLSGREDEAEEAYRALANRKDASFLGLRGLLGQAVDRRDWPAALDIARQAERAHPGTIWLRQQRAELALHTDNWADALELTGSDPRRPVYYVAAADAEADPKRALAFAKHAWKADPTFPPATLAYARRLREAGYESRARSAITEAWTAAPHPDLADFLLESQTDKLARMQVAQRLVERNPTHPESRMLLARTALDAGLTAEARRQIDLARAEGTNQRRLCLLSANLEEHDRGDTEAGRSAQRDALRQAASAEPDPHWECSNCRREQAAWQPKCSACGSVGTLQWVTTMQTPAAGGTPAGVPAVVG